MLDYFTCIRCKKVFDEFEMPDRAYKIDKQVICYRCRVILGLLHDKKSQPAPLHRMINKTGKQYRCLLCDEIIPKGSHEVQWKVIRGRRSYVHISCPEQKQGNLF